MTDEKLKTYFLSIPKPEIDQSRKETSICLVLSHTDEIRGLTRITYWDRIRTMAGYLSPWVWFAQAAVLLLGGYLFCSTPEDNFLSICSVLAPLIACIGCTEIQRGYYYGMWEMEKACRYDLRHVMLLKMQITGSIDLALIFCLMGFSAGRGIEFSKAVLAILMPYLLSSFVYFMLLCRVRSRFSSYVLAGAGIVMMLFHLSILESLDDVAWEIICGHSEWIAVLVIFSVDMVIWSMRRFFIFCDREENKKWNCA